MPLTPSHRRRERGAVLALALVLILVVMTGFATFIRRAVVDGGIARNRDRIAEAEALARGGVQLAIALLLEDLILEQQAATGSQSDLEAVVIQGDTLEDIWARIASEPIEVREGVDMRLRILDLGSRINLNAFVTYGVDEDGEVLSDAEEYLTEFFARVKEDSPLPPAETELWDERELARNLLEFLDPNDEPDFRGFESEHYLGLDPPRRAANRPLLSLDELREVEGFTRPLVDFLRNYVTVYPLVGAGRGVNLNSAPPHVLGKLRLGATGGGRFLQEDDVRRILEIRAERPWCDDSSGSEDCAGIENELGGSIYPPTVHPARSEVFEVRAQIRIGEIRRQAEAVVDRSVPGDVRLLSYRVF